MRVLIDADILRYQIGSIKVAHPFIEKEYIPAPESEICRLVEELIQHVLKVNGSTSYICALSGDGNFRKEIAKQEPYKGNRDPNSQRPYHYDTVGDYIIKNHPHVIVHGREADDWLGVEQRKSPEDTIIASRDKDMLTVFGWHYRWSCGEYQPEKPKHWISEFDSKKFFFEQMLHGDNTDNIIGCGKRILQKWGGEMKLRRKGVGEVAARKLIEPCVSVQEMFNVICDEYKKVFNEEFEDVMLENARLLYIGQSEDNLFNWDWLDFNLNKDVNNGEFLSATVSEPRNGDFGESGEYCEDRESPDIC